MTTAKRQRIQNEVNSDNVRYHNVCLTLDDSDQPQLCTLNDYGFDISSNSPPYEIDFVFPKQPVRKLQLSFNGDEPTNSAGNIYALISDLKIFYN